MSQIYAEDVNYFKTGQSSADAWIDKAKAEIKAAGGVVVSEAYGDQNGRRAFLLEFSFGVDRFRVVWPVLPTRTKREADERAAKIQAATMLYHDIKAKSISAKVFGVRAAFFQFLALPDGRTASEVATPEIAAFAPKLLQSGESGE